ncbi:serine/threonine protein kinase [Pseudenhygromyxa sp. WMMC2535]|uniref:serine/threonine-protein kinase n=1 Tax=Pseudenhygromyxa sp. WMMC2535 TaxID=2712867 RepID=UPI0015540B6F|nr:serine/threonine-protein kinase [Pseudenhygromyxa sp. WMMC2535]NVB42479.1 serine/threonine protein kinase [Pseudenhygromyxa sp. WMMC2535]
MDSEPKLDRSQMTNYTVADLDSDPGEARVRSTVGRYIILDSIGMGGMGLVCAAYDPKLNRKVALKLLRNASGDETNTSGRSRLFREAQALARLSHPNVVTVHDVDVFEDQVYIAMEFVEGTNLREWLRDAPRPWGAVLDKFIQAGRGLEAAHAAGIIHRDFKPSNVLLSKEGDVRVADFGVAKERPRGADSQRAAPDSEAERAELDRHRRTIDGDSIDGTAEDALIEEIQSNADAELTVAGRLVGTPAYMAPEQHMDLRLGPYTDQYAFCVSLYEALYGRLPFESLDRRERLAKMTAGKLPPPPREGNARAVPLWVHKVIARGLAPQPAERWPSMGALLDALQRDPKRRRRRVTLIALVFLGVAAGVLGFALGQEDEDDLCDGVGDEIHESWGELQRERIQTVFAESSKPFANDSARRVIQTLDVWAETWAAERTEICRATQVVGEQSERLMDVRMDCLDQARQDFSALVDVLTEADDEVVERSTGAASGLRRPTVCATVKASDESDPEVLDALSLEKLAAIDSELDRARARARLSKFDESLPLQSRAVERARGLDHPSTLLRALLELAESQLETGDAEGGEASLREAIGLAAQLDDPEQEARAWTRLIHAIGYRQDRPIEGKAWTLAASSAIIRAGDQPELWLRYDNAYAALLHRDGKYAESLERYQSALERAREVFGEEDPITLLLMVNTGGALGSLERYDEAKTLLREAATRYKNVYGPTHPKLAAVYINLGNAYTLDGDLEKADEALRAALDIREQVFGADSPHIAVVLQAIANVNTKRGRHQEALVDFQRAAEIFVADSGTQSSEFAVAQINIGRMWQELGDYEQAREAYDRALEIYDRLHPEPHYSRVRLHLRRCRLFAKAALWSDAAGACQDGLEEGKATGERAAGLLPLLYETLAEVEDARGRSLFAERARTEAEALRQVPLSEPPPAELQPKPESQPQ